MNDAESNTTAEERFVLDSFGAPILEEFEESSVLLSTSLMPADGRLAYILMGVVDGEDVPFVVVGRETPDGQSSLMQVVARLLSEDEAADVEFPNLEEDLVQSEEDPFAVQDSLPISQGAFKEYLDNAMLGHVSLTDENEA